MGSAVNAEVGQIEFDRHGQRTLLAPFRLKGAEAGAGAMLVACRLAGLSALARTMQVWTLTRKC